MKSIKPGRYNSGQGIIGAVFGIIFAIFWTVMAASSGAPIIFPIFGIGFIVLMVTELIKNVHNFTNKNRYSSFDIVESTEEPDPWNEKFHSQQTDMDFSTENEESIYCPYCGAKLAPDFEFCPKCGKKLPF